jgi:outer membrane protein
MTNRFAITALALAAIAAAPTAQAQAGDSGSWLIRARALYLDSANKDSTGLNLNINNKVFPEIDITYFITPNLATELILTYPQEHTLKAGNAEIGTVTHLPPTLLLQYHVTGLKGWRPYFGVGVNYTRFTDVDFTPAVVAALNPSIDKDSWGLAVQVGMDVPLGGGWSLNLDLKKVKLETDVYSGSTRAGTFKVDPLLFSVGAGYRF